MPIIQKTSGIKTLNVQKYESGISDNNHSNHPDTLDPVYDEFKVDAIILLVSEYKSHSSCKSPSFSETKENKSC